MARTFLSRCWMERNRLPSMSPAHGRGPRRVRFGATIMNLQYTPVRKSRSSGRRMFGLVETQTEESKMCPVVAFLDQKCSNVNDFLMEVVPITRVAVPVPRRRTRLVRARNAWRKAAMLHMRQPTHLEGSE